MDEKKYIEMESYMSTQELIRELQAPGTEFSPVPFWFFNDAFEEERVRKQLEDYVEKGVNGFVLHPRIGVPEDMPYLSERYFEAVRFIVKTADELGMKVVLYDEGMYPSGSAHGKVVEKNPEFAMELAVKGILPLPDGRECRSSGRKGTDNCPFCGWSCYRLRIYRRYDSRNPLWGGRRGGRSTEVCGYSESGGSG